MFTDKYKEYHFFWETASPFSQWHKSTFKAKNNLTFYTAEQYMMYCKAETFNDKDSINKILKEKNPRLVKAIGREVKNFNIAKWDKVKYQIVLDGSYQKFTQNTNLLKELLLTKGKYLVESSPYDKIWGIGMHKDDEGVEDPSNWKGENLLGKALTELREDLEKKYKIDTTGNVIKINS